jgi:hypothetical protein
MGALGCCSSSGPFVVFFSALFGRYPGASQIILLNLLENPAPIQLLRPPGRWRNYITLCCNAKKPCKPDHHRQNSGQNRERTQAMAPEMEAAPGALIDKINEEEA